MIIGVTGGIGSGKSKVLSFVKENLDCIVITTDDVAKEQQNLGGVAYNEIVKAFGEKILKEDKTINRRALSDIVFNDKLSLEKLNKITHKYVIAYIKEVIRNNQNKIIFIESALLLDSSIHEMCNEIWLVYASVDIRKERLVQKRGFTGEKVDEIMANQRKMTDYVGEVDVLINNNNIDTMELDVMKNIKRIKETEK